MTQQANRFLSRFSLPSLLLTVIVALLVSLLAPIVPARAANETVSIWITSADRSRLMQQQSSVNFGADTGSASYTIDVNEGTTYQTMDGFGASITDSSAYLMYQLSSTARTNLMTALFSPTSGAGISFLRQPIGSSDYTVASSHWTFDDRPAGQTDYNMTYFSIAHDQAQVIPLLQQALQLNPSIKVMLSPWSPPAWMKDSGSLIGGHIKTDSATLNAYALYLVKSIQAYEAAGIPIYALTVQNEPQNRTPNGYPGTDMPVAHEAAVINALGPALANAGLSRVKIIAFDHNWTLHPDDAADAAAMGENPEPDYPLNILATSANQYIAGTAWHMYSGDASRQTTVHNAYPNKDAWFTEGSGWHGSADAYSKYFSDTMDWHMQNIFMASIQNWAKSVVNWNMALNSTGGPGLGGCLLDATRATNPGYCQGVVTISGTTVTYNAEYYDLGHFAKFVKVGAARIASTDNGSMRTAAFRNPDGTKALVVYNVNGGTSSIKVRWNSQAFVYNVPAKSIATFTWGTAAAVPTATRTRTPTPSGPTATPTRTITPGGPTLTPTRTNTAAPTATRTNTAVPSNYVNVIARHSGKCLDVSGNSTGDGAWMQQWTCTGGANQNFQFVPVSGTSYYQIIARNSGKCMDVQNGSTANGALIQQWTCAAGNINQQFSLQTVSGTSYIHIIARVSGKCFDVQNVSTADGAWIQQWTCGTGTNQQWSRVQVP